MSGKEINSKDRFSNRAENYSKYRPGYPKEMINFLESYKNFYSINGSSEDTKLEQESIDIIVAAQAFHWFNPKPTREEFLRILKPNGIVLALWNIRKRENSDFMKDYLEVLKKYREKLEVNSDISVTPEFFKRENIEKKVFCNPHEFDLNRLKGELSSYSYMPNEDDPRFNPMMKDLESIFNKYEYNGSVVLEYETEVYYCNMK